MIYHAKDVEVGDIVSTDNGPEMVRSIEVIEYAFSDDPEPRYLFEFTSGEALCLPGWESVRVFEGF